jgi:phosphate transport system substrate-binding protein
MKKLVGIIVTCVLAVSLLAACGGKGNDAITVISREDGSGTRGAFIELFGIEEKDASGEKVDHTIDSADITNSTSVMLTSVAQNKAAIGYVSLGSLNNTVKALAIDGAAATAENVKNGSYKISRPFNIATMGAVSPVTQDFIDFILSSDGQAVVEKAGYIALPDMAPYDGGNQSGKIVVAGSSSVTPVMEKLKEAYIAVNPGVTIEVQQSDSTTGMTSAIDGVCDIGMASRALKDSEKEKGLQSTVIATDGIAVIVNLENAVSGMSADQVKQIYTGALTKWSEIK